MVNARIGLMGEDLLCETLPLGGHSARRRLDAAALERLAGWATTYDGAVRKDEPGPLLAIGRDIAVFLNGDDAWLDRALDGVGEFGLEIAVPANPATAEEKRAAAALLEVPWELLAPGGLYLALDEARLFRVARRLGTDPDPAPPAHGDLTLLFMAAEVEGQSQLAYEREEAAILTATATLDRLHLVVEESGGVDGLRDRLAETAGAEALHVTAHGSIGKDGPFLALEDAEGGLDVVGVGRLCAALGEQDKQPRLVVLSACRTAEGVGAAGSYTQALVRAGVANALGWDGSVYDEEATGFAATFYGELAAGRSVPYAAAAARRGMLKAHMADPRQGRHWHLARVWLGPQGGGALCDARRPTRKRPGAAATRAFLDKANSRVPVATPEQFVGRRRPLQRALRALGGRARAEGVAGVLLHGMGNAGKSSLAARILSRMPKHHPVVLFRDYDRITLFDALVNALPPPDRAAVRKAWVEPVRTDDEALRDFIQHLLDGPLSGRDGTRPVLLVVDDLEQRLHPQPGQAATPFKTPEDHAVFGALLAAFRDADTESRLLLTSRYDFALGDGRGDDLAARLARVPLPPMDPVQRDKQMRSAAWLAGREREVVSDARAALMWRIKDAAAGNPGLQEILTRPLMAGDEAGAETAVAAVEAYRATGDVPAEANAAFEFFRRVSLTAYRAMLTAAETQQLRAATLFTEPVPRAVLAAAGAAAGVPDPSRALARLVGLGLLDLYQPPDDDPPAAGNPLARPLVPPLTEAESATIAAAAIGPLVEAWTGVEGEVPWDGRGLETARLALLGNAQAAILERAAHAGGRCLFDGQHDAKAALGLVETALGMIRDQGAAAGPTLFLLGAQCAERLGRAHVQDDFLEQGIAAADGDPKFHAILLTEAASRRHQTGDLDAALDLLRTAERAFADLKDDRSRAVAMGRIADILQARGETEEALRIRREELLPVFERLGDVRSRAVTMGRIADILQARGETDEALRIRREEELPVYERLGDVHSRAVTMGRIADILQDRGETDETLRIFREEQLPVFERLGSVHERAVTMGRIADILQARGETDEALRIHLEERLPVALDMRDIDSVAHIRFNCASIRLQRGDLESEAETILSELAESFTISRKLGRVDAIGVVGFLFGQVLAAIGLPDEARRVLGEAEAACAKLGRTDRVAKIRELLEAIGEDSA